jgi:hypothetical protein
MRKVLVAAAILTALYVLISWANKPTDGPEIPAWDRDVCAHCAMLVGDPRFAAQIQTTDGRVHHFDDPGCLHAWRALHRPEERAAWFHHVAKDEWIPGDRVAFIPAPGSPMGHDLGAVPR